MAAPRTMTTRQMVDRLTDFEREIEAKFDRVIVPLTDEQVAAAWEADRSLADRVTVTEHIDYREHATSDISDIDAMAKLREKALAFLGSRGGEWIAWRVKPVVKTEHAVENDKTTHRAYLRFGYKPQVPIEGDEG